MQWRRFVAVFIGAFVALLAGFLAAIILIDPYDTGYFPSIVGPGVVDDNDVTGIAGRGRDSRFNAGIFGNSHGLLLAPSRLSPATGLSFVQLTALGSGPREQMALIGYFLRRHADAKALVLAADQSWCTRDPALPAAVPLIGDRFPHWLFGDSRLRYLANMLSSRPLRLVQRRVELAMGRLAPIDPAGTAGYPTSWDFVHAVDRPPEPHVPLNGSPIRTDFPAIDRLDALLATVPPDVAVVAAMPPLYYELLPDPETRQAAELAACKARLARTVDGRGRGAFLDFLADSPLSRARTNFYDKNHMGETVARAMEARIAQALNASR